MKKNNFWFKEISKICICIILVLVTLILFKVFPNFKENFYTNVYEKNFSFAFINDVYKKYFGSSLPFENLFNNTNTVFNEKLKYTNHHKYLDGVKLIVEENYLVPTLDRGLVVFIGEKEEYGNTIIIQQSNGIDVWYGHMDNINVSMYEYVDQGDLLGEVNTGELYLLFKQDGEVLDYQKYI